MKILWILNSPIGEISTVLGLSRSQSGTWIDAAMESLLLADSSLKLTILTTAKIQNRLIKKTENVTYICLPTGKMLRGKRTPEKQLLAFCDEIKELQPDLIHIWGTEFSLGYDLKRKVSDIPFVYTMQGVMSHICKYPFLNLKGMKKDVGWFSKVRCLKYHLEQKIYRSQASFEQEMIAEADAVIADNEWAVSCFSSARNASKFHFIRLPIKKQFREESWNQEEAEENTLFCIAGRNGLKGIHQAIKSVELLKRDFPEIKLLIPGNISGRKPAFLFEPPYIEYLKNMISSKGLQENIVFLGQLTTEEMIIHMKRAKVFVMPSAIENESSTLREAMFLGMPIVTSFAGDIYETVVHGKNGLVYRFEEYEMLTHFARELLENPEKADMLGKNAKESIANQYQNHNYGKSLLEVYNIRKAGK